MRVLFPELRKQGLESSACFDDVYLQGSSYDLCQANILTTAKWLMKFGFVIHPSKSEFYPTRQLTHVGFSLNLEAMTVSIPPQKAHQVRAACEKIQSCERPTIREVARVTGCIMASFSAVTHGKLHYRNIELDKINALSHAKGRYDRPHGPDTQCKGRHPGVGWILHSPGSRPLLPSAASKCVLSDASDKGWGGVVRNTDLTAGGLFTEWELSLHI